MPASPASTPGVQAFQGPPTIRVAVDGKFFRLGGRRLFVKGVTYGPFPPDPQGDTFGSPEQAAQDFGLVTRLGANVLRVYHPPPGWFLDLAHNHGLKVLVDIPWAKHLCFLDSKDAQATACQAVRQAVTACRGHPAVLAYSVASEIPPDIVRWSGVRRVEAFIDQLIDVAKDVDPTALCTFTNFPPTEFLCPEQTDFVCFNVYLHHRPAFEAYLARLQLLADSKPLLLGETGIDCFREGEARQAEILSWQIESAARAGLAGVVLFSFTDEWWRGGHRIENWAFGLTTSQRQPRPAFAAVQRQFAQAPYFALPRTPRVSVVVATYNGARTLRLCLESLGRLNYPDYEVIVVDDGSTDAVPHIATQFPAVRYCRQPHCGLGAARNTGIAAATGQIVAFTDDDCRADPDWLYYLVSELVRGDFVGVGGPNLLPPDDSVVAAVVMAAPGGPAHVMLDDRLAEHVPGCNMAFWKWALEEIGGFDPVFQKAGDDVDVCWRLQQRGYRIGFSPSAFVWHYRRSTIRAYLKQQAGYGEAEALLARKHPEYFNWLGASQWRGRIYGASHWGLVTQRAVIYHGAFGSGFFQRLYSRSPAYSLMLLTSLEYHALVTLPLGVLSLFVLPLWPVAAASAALSVGVCVAAALQAKLPKRKCRWWSRPLLALLFLLQPIRRGWARYAWRLNTGATPPSAQTLAAEGMAGEPPDLLAYWVPPSGPDRLGFIQTVMARLEADQWQVKPDNGWNSYDLEVLGNPLARLRLLTVAEELGEGKRTIRCRLRPRWSLQARLLWAFSLGAALLIIAAVAPLWPWIWLSLLGLPCLAWWLDHHQQRLHRAIVVVLDEVARSLGLVKQPPQQQVAGANQARQPSQTHQSAPASPIKPEAAGSLPVSG
jgi:GT2 family glycosyltransferase